MPGEYYEFNRDEYQPEGIEGPLTIPITCAECATEFSVTLEGTEDSPEPGGSVHVNHTTTCPDCGATIGLSFMMYTPSDAVTEDELPQDAG